MSMKSILLLTALVMGGGISSNSYSYRKEDDPETRRNLFTQTEKPLSKKQKAKLKKRNNHD